MTETYPRGVVAVNDDDWKASSIYTQDDPLSLMIRPPASESLWEKEARIELEAEARRVSEQIDAGIRRDKVQRAKSKNDVKLLLLGQAESGKSTFLKQFRLAHDPDSLERERASWRTVVYHNIAQAVAVILRTLEAHDDAYEPSASSGRSSSDDVATEPPSSSLPAATRFLPSTPRATARTPMQQQIATLRLRLSPLVAAERSLATRLSGGLVRAGEFGGGDVLYVRAGWQERAALDPLRRKAASPGAGSGGRGKGKGSERDELVEDVANVLHGVREDVAALWRLPMVRSLIERRKLRFDEWAEYFLDDILRVSAPDYTPTVDDTLRARIQTIGVQEHIFNLKGIEKRHSVWHVYDVGGARGQRHTWVNYFDDCTAIIFMAPVSAFDQWLDEDPKTNRLDDSMKLFETVCAHPLLRRVQLVLFLNKTDILRRKLSKGIRVNKYITSFGDRANEHGVVTDYFRNHFMHVFRRNSDRHRQLYTHFTTVVDSRETSELIRDVRDTILRGYLSTAALT